MSYSGYLKQRAAVAAKTTTRRTAAHDMVIQPGPFKLKGPVTKPRDLEILVLDKNFDTEKKYNLDSDADYKQFRKDPANLGYPEYKYQGTKTTEEKILESARAVKDKAETKQSDFVLLVPATFYGLWKENSNTWIQRLIRHVDMLDKNFDTEKKYNLDSDADYKQFRKDPANLGYPEYKYQGTKTTEEKILESARAVKDKAETKQSDFVLLVPATFYGLWKENSNTWIQRLIRHVDSTKRPLLSEELVEYVGYQLEGRA
ncbi:hypothetical protein AYI69_g3387 [Smittium culicis]|uniref:Uncharacterized protein n=1 Tax=Smittium culicis TaxID=133412 RepID=A0A1R1YK65_9FUNG|nr:hypothetical protein AYI69_g3387 [Smittium culicis]